MKQDHLAVRDVAVQHHHVDAGRFVHWYERMAESRFANAFAYGRAKVDRVLDACFKELAPGARILDVGCGTGEYVRRANELGFEASGVEPADAMRARAIEQNPQARILPGVATELPFPDQSFDLVICIEVLRYLHQADNELALKEMRRVLKPGGSLFLTMVNRYALDGFYLHYQIGRLLRRGRESAEFPHCEFTTPSQIERQIRDAGFSKVTHHGVLLGPMRLIYKASERLGRALTPTLEPIDDAISALPGMTRFAGHLITLAER
jgi:ubiquinone/menaquinone biosynthesis C-methylase UbiE